jgi:redox-sensitive bicupin YhaK (pirin superfamily)
MARRGAGRLRMINALRVLVGRPLRESIVWYGPFVMNTREEIEKAMRD